MKKEVTLIFLLLEPCSSFFTGLLTLSAVDHRNKVHGAFVLCWLLIHESYISFRLVQCVVALPKVIQWSFPHRRDLTFKGYVVAPSYGCHVCPPWNVSEGITYQKFLVRETNARFILHRETIF